MGEGPSSLWCNKYPRQESSVITDHIRIREILFGLPELNILGVTPIILVVETRLPGRSCPNCKLVGTSKERTDVDLVDLPASGNSILLRRRKRFFRHENDLDEVVT